MHPSISSVPFVQTVTMKPDKMQITVPIYRHISISQTTWMQEQGLGGIMLWSLDLDDPTGKFCNQGPFPLATTVKAVLEGKRLVELEHLRSEAWRIESMRNALFSVMCLVILLVLRL